MNGTTTTILSDDLISRCGSRAAGYDRENRFFTEDFEELRAAGYLKMAVPEQLGGRGMSLAEVCREQRRLAYRAPATALATNMHLYWTGVAADLRKAGDSSLEWMLRGSRRRRGLRRRPRRGRQRPAALPLHGQGRARRRRLPVLRPQDLRQPHAGLDAPRAARDGRRPTRADRRSSTPSCRATRRATRSRRRGTRSACGPRAATTRSSTARSCPTATSRGRLPAGTADLFVLSIFAWAEPTFGNIYFGLARARARPGGGQRQEAHVARAHPLDGLPPGGPAQRRRDGAGARGDRTRRSDRDRRRLVERRRSRRRVADEARGGQVQRGRGARRRSSTSRWTSPAAPACSSATSSSGSTATSAAAASTRPTRSWSTRSSARRRSASTSASSRAGDDLSKSGSVSGASGGRAAGPGAQAPRARATASTSDSVLWR